MCALAALVGLVVDPVSAVRAYIVGGLGIVEAPDAAAHVAVNHFVLNALCLEVGAVSGVVGDACGVRGGEVTGSTGACLCTHIEQVVNVGLVVDGVAPDVLAVCDLTGQSGRGRIDAERENEVKVAHLASVAQGRVARVLPGVGGVDILHTDVQVGAVPAGKQRVGVDQAVLMGALVVVGTVPCRAGRDNHILRPIGKIAVNRDVSRFADLAAGIGLVVTRQAGGAYGKRRRNRRHQHQRGE